MKTKQKLRAEVDRVRLRAGLALFNGPLLHATCESCGRTYQWRPEKLPTICPWPSCGGQVRLIETAEQ